MVYWKRGDQSTTVLRSVKSTGKHRHECGNRRALDVMRDSERTNSNFRVYSRIPYRTARFQKSTALNMYAVYTVPLTLSVLYPH